MNDLKNKLYNYEATPPPGVWDAIASELDSEKAKVVPLPGKNNKRYYYIAAASIAVILFSVIFFNIRSNTKDDFIYSKQNNSDTTSNNTALLTVPQQEENLTKNTDTISVVTDNKLRKGGPNQKISKPTTALEKQDDNNLATNSDRYMTIEGPEGQPVKVSSKMATLIDSSETKTSSKPIWNKKVNEWKEIMKGNTLAPTPGNFLDIVELTKSLKDKKP